MAGLLAWAADVVGGGGQNDDDGAIRIVLSPDQQSYAIELDYRAASLSRLIQDLRLRIPPPDISQRLPHLHALSLASNADLALQLNAHSSTKEQAQLREVTLQEENAGFEKAISNCEQRIQEKLQEADVLRTKLKDLESAEENLRSDLENAQIAFDVGPPGESLVDSKSKVEDKTDTEDSESAILAKLENKQKELSFEEARVQSLEKKWAQLQDYALRQPTPAQREKMLDKQLHSSIEQLAAKQAQAEGLVNEIHIKQKELDTLNGTWRRLETSNMEASNARNRFSRSSSEKIYASSDYIVDPHQKPNLAGRTGTQQRLMLLRSAFVLYILALHILVFIKISF